MEGIKLSGLKHLQEKVLERCSQLPQTFTRIDEWKIYRGNLLNMLTKKLPVWEVNYNYPSFIMAELELGSDLILENIDLHFDESFYIPVHIYRMKNNTEKSPAVIVCPDYGQRKNSPDIINVCMSLARKGIVALAMEFDGTGERSDRPDWNTGINNVTAVANLIGITNIGLQVMSSIAAFNYLKHRDDIDPERIGITGICQGGITAWFTAAICEELSATALLCAVSTYETVVIDYYGGTSYYHDFVPECLRSQGLWHCSSPFVNGLLDFADMQHVISCIAPRPLFVQNSITDMHWPLSGYAKTKEFVENIYGLYEKKDKCKFILRKGVHAFQGEFLNTIIEWFSNVL